MPRGAALEAFPWLVPAALDRVYVACVVGLTKLFVCCVLKLRAQGVRHRDGFVTRR